MQGLERLLWGSHDSDGTGSNVWINYHIMALLQYERKAIVELSVLKLCSNSTCLCVDENDYIYPPPPKVGV